MRLWDIIPEYVAQRDDRPTLEYAADKIDLFPPITRTGKFHADTSRHFIPILEALDDGRVREVNILKPVRGGGSLIGDVHLACTLPSERTPGPYMNVFQTDADAKMHFFDRIERMMAGNEVTRGLLPSKYEWSEIRLNNGHTLYTGGPTLSNLQSKGVRYLRLDECWIYPPGRMAEAEARVGEYFSDEMSKIIRISQGGPRDGVELDACEWHRAYHRAEVNEWEVACLHCGKYYDPVFSGRREDGTFWGITWDQHRLPNNDWDIPKCLPTIRFECPHCKQPVLDCAKTKAEWNRTGRYRRTTERRRDCKSFHWEATIFFPWTALVELWLDAANAERRGDLRPKLQFYQKRRAMFRDLASLLKGGLHFKRTAYEIVSDWPDEKMRFLSIDRQQEDTFWWTVRAWSTEKSRRLGFGKAYGWAAIEEIREKFKVQPNRTLIDSGFQPKGDNGVYQACLRYGWIAVKGADEYDFIHAVKRFNRIVRVRKSYAPIAYGDPESGLGKEGRRYCRLIRFSKPQYNQRVQELVESGAWEEPATGDKETEKEYADQMAARIQRRDRDPRTGREKVYWYESPNDHARDLANMQLLGAILGELVRDPVTEIQTKSEKAEIVKEEKKVVAA